MVHEPARLLATEPRRCHMSAEEGSGGMVAPAGIHWPVRRAVRPEREEPGIAVRLLRRRASFGLQAAVSACTDLSAALRDFADASALTAALRFPAGLAAGHHAFTHGWSLPRAVRRTSPKCP
jgi:hypothetical protein